MHKQVHKCPNHAANLNNMRLNNRWFDLTIKVDDEEFRAHKNVLAANLQYFETMLSADSFRESKEGLITMHNNYVNPKDLEAFVTYAYTGEITLTDENALSLLRTADYLGENGIKRACTEFLEKHLKVEESLQAYDLAKSVDCLSLKNAAKSRILSNFESISQSIEYLGLDFEKLSDILSDEKAQAVESQRIFFEGIMRWILNDAKQHRSCINDLLRFINVSKLPLDYFMEYVGSLARDNDDDSMVVVKDLISWYYTSSKTQLNPELRVAYAAQTLTILGVVGLNLSFQFYNFAARKWSKPQSIAAAADAFYFSCAVLNNKFYIIIGKSGSYTLNMFDPSTKLITVLNSSSSILKFAALCASSRFLYLCGGTRGPGSRSNQVLRYDPQTNSYESLPPMPTLRSGAAAVFYRGCLHVLGGWDGSPVTNKVEKYDPDTKTWIGLPSTYEPGVQNRVAVLDGKLYACGGYRTSSLEVYDPAKNSWQRVASMNIQRRRFTLVAHEGKLLAIGGVAEKSVEVYDPILDRWQMDDEMSSGMRFGWNMGGLISSSCITDAP